MGEQQASQEWPFLGRKADILRTRHFCCGATGRCSTPFGTMYISPGPIELPSGREKIICVIVFVPNELVLHLHDHNVIAIELRNGS
jgi:hypothetical protein